MATTTSKLILKVNLFAFALGFSTLKANAQTIQTIIRPIISNIAYKLQKDNYVHFGYPVGFSGKPERNNKYFKLYKRLNAKAKDLELVELTKSKSEVIVVYAFDVLRSRNYEGLKNIFLEHVNDTTWFWTAGGCTGFVDRINWFMIRRLKPVEGTVKNYLTKNEYELFCSRFKNEDALFLCD